VPGVQKIHMQYQGRREVKIMEEVEVMTKAGRRLGLITDASSAVTNS
jgi:hypothetical protein